ncbi:DNA-binding NarL/FixJ family response regulator [Actinoplanes lutulentus]|nr:DNA-binding NarL/FixJ family response regulator [Actinoplanes lutulentus]
MIRVVVVDDEALVRSGFDLILSAAPDLAVVATATGGEALDVIREHRPDVVLLDIRMPDVDGLTILGHIRAFDDPPAVAMLTTFDADEYVVAALDRGAAGFLLKDTDPEQLAQFVRTLAGGGVVLAPKASRTLLRNLPASATTDGGDRMGRLSEPERDVLRLLAQGLSNAEIGVRLHLGTGTVRDHVSVVLEKLRVSGRVQAALLAQKAQKAEKVEKP